MKIQHRTQHLLNNAFFIKCILGNEYIHHLNCRQPTIDLIQYQTDYRDTALSNNFSTLIIIFQPKSLLRRPSKKVETYVQGCVPIYPNTIRSYASFIFDSDHLTCSLIQFHTACPTARQPNTCYSPRLNTHVIQITHYHFVSYTIMQL